MDALSRLVQTIDSNWQHLRFSFYGFWQDKGWITNIKAYEIFGIMSGSVNIELNDEIVKLHPGDYVFLNGTPRCSCPGGSFSLYQAVFYSLSDSLTGELDTIFAELAGTVLRTGDESLMPHFASFCDEQSFIRPFADIAAKESFLRLIIGLARVELANETDAGISIHEDLSRSLADYLRKRYSDDITLDMMEKQFGYNKKYLNRIFKSNTGITLKACLMGYRIEAAKRLLVMTSARISEIGEETGFYDTPHFCRCFKTSTGMSPREFRIVGR